MLRFLTAGESHGPCLAGILEGLPAGLPLSAEELDRELARRQRGAGSGGRMKIERDKVRIEGGVLAGKTTGGPLALRIDNLDHSRWRSRDIKPMTIPRPGHADLVGAVKYGYRDLRLSLERASARETAMRVAVGAACRTLLGALGIEVGGYVTRIGTVAVPLDIDSRESFPSAERYRERWQRAEESPVRCYDRMIAGEMERLIHDSMKNADTIGGVIECVALGVPAGLGSYVQWDRRLSAQLGHALLSIPSARGFEIGDGFASTLQKGTQAQDAFLLGTAGLTQRSNHGGGLAGGVSTGAPLVVRVALKPIATTLTAQPSVDLASGAAAPTQYERSDFCHVPRAAPIAEAMVCFVLAQALLEKLGGDSVDELQMRLRQLRQPRLADLPMDNVSWRLGYV